MDTETEVKDFIKKLKEHLSDDRKQRNFHQEHNFKREVEYYKQRIDIIEEILFKLEVVIEGDRKGHEITFTFDK